MLIDTTLREGAQMYGVLFTQEQRKDVVLGLARMGVEEIEAGWVGMDGLPEFLDWSGPRLNSSHMSVWSRCREADLRLAAASGATRVNVGVPASEAHRAKRLGMSRRALLRLMRDNIALARRLGMDISIGLEDISRADRKFALKLALAAEDAGAFRVRLSDTVGQLDALDMAHLVRTFREELVIDIAVHCHDDFGMGTANAVTALRTGADWTDASLLGIGERSGLAATEEVAAYLCLRDKTRNYSLEHVRELCSLVSGVAGVPMPRNKAVAGRDIFACETGLHLHGMAQSPELFEPYAPDAVSGARRAGFGPKSGSFAVRRAMKRHGLDNRKELLEKVMQGLRDTAARLGRPLTEEELEQLMLHTGKEAA